MLAVVGRRRDEIGEAAEVQRHHDVAARGEIGEIDRRCERRGIEMRQLCPLPDVGFLAGLLLALVEADHQVFLLEVQAAFERRARAGAGIGLGHARMRAGRGAEQVHVVDAERVEPALGAVQLVADPFDPGAGPEAPVAAADDADRHFLAGFGQRELVGRAVAQSRLFGDDRIVIERVDARLLQFDVKTPFAREQRERRGGQREADEASKADSGHRERARRPASRDNSTIRGGEGYRGSGTPASRGP